MEGNSITAFENLCRIFEMRIKLDREKGVKTSLDVLDNYEKYSKKIDTVYNNEFQKELKPLISPAITLEKEEDRLRRLIKLLEERLDRRIELEDRFYNSTGKYITGLQMIVSEAELEEKKERLSLITNYLETNREIENIIDSINKLRDSLEEEETKKLEYETKNKIMEDELYSSFINIINEIDYYKNINEENISDELDAIRSKVSETKETLEITKESVGSLISSGLEDDYTSYVEEAERSYYSYKNKELILKIYKLVISFEDDFKQMCSKREKISELLEEKKNLRENLNVDNEDELLSFEKILLVQIKTLDNEREVLENIANYTSRIKFKEERLTELNEINSSSEVLVILREYGLVEAYDALDIPEEVYSEEQTEVVEEESNTPLPEIELPVIEEPLVEEFYDPYRIVEVKDYPRTLNVGLAKLKGESVREKVNKKLNPKEEFRINDYNLMQDEKTECIIPDNSKVESTISEEKVEEILPVHVEEQKENTLTLDTKEEVISSISNDVIENNITEENAFGSEVPVSSVISEPKVELPVWEIPTEAEPNPISFENSSTNNLPVWEMVEPLFEVPKNLSEKEEINSIDILSNPTENSNNSANDMFWVPVSDSKLETKDFPNINIPISNNFNGNDNFGFPTIKTEGE